jgi:hypothetical protein
MPSSLPKRDDGFESTTEKNYPLPHLYVSMLQCMGLEADRFATSTETMRGLEMA